MRHTEQNFVPSETLAQLKKQPELGDPCEIAGIHHYKDDALAFFAAVQKCESRDWFYSLILSREPDNPHDPHAISVWGAWTEKSWLKTKDRQEQLGYVPRDLAAEIARTTPETTRITAEIDEMNLSSSGLLEIWMQAYTDN